MTASPSTPQRLYLMQVAYQPSRNTPFVCYLVQAGDKNILIDSGLPDVIEPPPGQTMPDAGKNVIEQLALIGIQPEDIDLLVCTHFDSDHVGHHEDFPNAQLIVQRKHYDAALTSPRFARSRPHWDQPIERFRFVDGDTELLPGLELIETSGHVPGHQSVLVRLPSSTVLLAIDAVPRQALFTRDREGGPADDNADEARASAAKLIDIVEREGVSLVVFGHDGDQWQMLKKLPEWYA